MHNCKMITQDLNLHNIFFPSIFRQLLGQSMNTVPQCHCSNHGFYALCGLWKTGQIISGRWFIYASVQFFSHACNTGYRCKVICFFVRRPGVWSGNPWLYLDSLMVYNVYSGIILHHEDTEGFKSHWWQICWHLYVW